MYSTKRLQSAKRQQNSTHTHRAIVYDIRVEDGLHHVLIDALRVRQNNAKLVKDKIKTARHVSDTKKFAYLMAHSVGTSYEHKERDEAL